MNWDWEKLQNQRKRQPGYTPPEMGDMGEKFKKMGDFKLPGGIRWLVLLFLLAAILFNSWYTVQPDEVGVVKRFGAYHRTTTPGLNFKMPFPLESVDKPKVTQVRRAEIGFRSVARRGEFVAGQFRDVPDESLMLTGDENIVDVQFVVQYQISDPEDFLYNVAAQDGTVHNVAEAAMREVIGNNKIDSALTAGKLEIQNATLALMQDVLDRYRAGIRVVAVQLQDVQPPKEVIDAFKDVASAREDRSRIINEAEAYRNDILPKARGLAAAMVNDAEAEKQSLILDAQGGATRFNSVLEAYSRAPDVTRTRLYLETMEKILANPELEKVLLPGGGGQGVVPLLPLGSFEGVLPSGQTPKPAGRQ